MRSGKLEAVLRDRQRRTGSMPQKNCDPVTTRVDPAVADLRCPKCGGEMEPIERGVEGPRIEQLQLCPDCYLVTWSDADGLHLQQGVPMKREWSLAANKARGERARGGASDGGGGR